MNQLDQQQLHLHVTILGWLLIVGNALFLVMGVSGSVLQGYFKRRGDVE